MFLILKVGLIVRNIIFFFETFKAIINKTPIVTCSSLCSEKLQPKGVTDFDTLKEIGCMLKKPHFGDPFF